MNRLKKSEQLLRNNEIQKNLYKKSLLEMAVQIWQIYPTESLYQILSNWGDIVTVAEEIPIHAQRYFSWAINLDEGFIDEVFDLEEFTAGENLRMARETYQKNSSTDLPNILEAMKWFLKQFNSLPN